MTEFDVDRALGNTPAAFSNAMQAALQSCREDAPIPQQPHRVRKVSLALAIALILMLFTGTAYAIVRVGGFLWFADNYIGYWETYYPETYERIKQSLQGDVSCQHLSENDLVDFYVDDVAWLPDEVAVFCLHAAAVRPETYEVHDAGAFNTDGESDFALWTDKGFGHPKDTMYDPGKQLVLMDADCNNIRIGAPDGVIFPACAYSSHTTPEGDVLWYIEIYDMEYLDPAAMERRYRDSLASLTEEKQAEYYLNGYDKTYERLIQQAAEAQALIREAARKDGILALYVPYTLDYLSWNPDDPEDYRITRDQPGGMLRFDVRVSDAQ